MSFFSRFSIFPEFWQFIHFRKRYWLGPIIFLLLIFALLIIFAESSVIAPFIYSLF